MIVQLLGKEHRKGKSKSTGRDYDFTVIHVSAKQRYVDGLAALQKIVGAEIYSFDKLLVNQYYDIEPDFDGNIISVRPAKP